MKQLAPEQETETIELELPSDLYSRLAVYASRKGLSPEEVLTHTVKSLAQEA